MKTLKVKLEEYINDLKLGMELVQKWYDNISIERIKNDEF